MKKFKKEILDELREISPSFSELEKKESFKVPENYFSELPDKILAELDLSGNKTQAETPLASIRPNWINQLLEGLTILLQPRVAVGFGVILVLLVSVFLFTKSGIESSDPLAGITGEEAEQYILNNIEDFDQEILLEALAEVEGAGELEALKNWNLDEGELDQLMDEIIEDMDNSDLEEFL